jgi:RNA polymerase sigma-70 factor (ECF subfamily)
LYRRLIYGFARRSGLSHADAEDVVQEVLARVAETICGFECDHARGTFRGWLMNLTRWRIANRISRRPREEAFRAHRSRDATTRRTTPTIERIPDPSSGGSGWEEEWQRYVLDAACQRLSRRAKPTHYQVFDLYVRQHQPVLKVSRELRVNPASVYVIASRLTHQLKREVARLREQLG